MKAQSQSNILFKIPVQQIVLISRWYQTFHVLSPSYLNLRETIVVVGFSLMLYIIETAYLCYY